MHAQSAKTWWYKNGVADSVYYRTDIVSFKCFGSAAYTGVYDPTIIDSIVYKHNRRDKANEIYFNPSSTLLQRVTEATSIYNSGQVQMIYLNVSKNIIASTDKLYIVLII